MTPAPLRLVIFDCDGVLIDSEGLSNRVVAEEVTAVGWAMTAAESMDRFVGMTLTDMVPMIEAQIRKPVGPAFLERLKARMIAALGAEVEAMHGAEAVLLATASLGLPYRIASNSSHAEMEAKFGRTGLAPLVAGRVHSAFDVTRGKPAPDLFLHAAAMEGVPPDSCIVVEDSVAGARAARAAGMACLGLDPHGDGARLRAEGAVPVRALAELPAIFQVAMRQAAA